MQSWDARCEQNTVIYENSKVDGTRMSEHIFSENKRRRVTAWPRLYVCVCAISLISTLFIFKFSGEN